jgi:hypothetical protein
MATDPCLSVSKTGGKSSQNVLLREVAKSHNPLALELEAERQKRGGLLAAHIRARL